jgi:MFS family permease
LIGALCLVVTLSYGALYYGFAVLITRPAAGSEFSRGLLSAAYGGSVLTSGLAAVPVGRAADRFGVRWLVAGGALAGAGGLLAFGAAQAGWQVLAVWWLVLGPVAALTFYEPAYVAIQQAFGAEGRARAIAVLTLTAGFSGPIFTPLTGELVDALGWRDTTRVLALAMACAAPVAALLIKVGPPTEARERRRKPSLDAFRASRVRVFTLGAVLAYGATEALIVHRIARFQELGFSLGTVTFWAALSGLATLPGRYLLPLLARRVPATVVFAGVLGVLAISAGLMIEGDAYWQMALSFVVFGLVFGSALPLRAVVMGEWTATAVFGTVMGAQAAMIAVGRAGTPALTGGMHDWLDGYTAAMALICGMLVAGAVLVLLSGRRARR